MSCNILTFNFYTGGSCLSQSFWEHEILSGLSGIQLIYIKLYKEKEKEIQAKQESGLTAVRLKWDLPVKPLFKADVMPQCYIGRC